MNTLTLTPSRAPAHTSSAPSSPGRGLGLLLVAEALLSFAPVLILGAAIGWPASLDKPAAEQLAAIGANADAVALGYGLYLLYSILVAPVMIGWQLDHDQPRGVLVVIGATLLLAVAAATAGVALLCRRHQARSLCLDVAGVLAFVGITVSILIEPDQMVRLVTLSNPPD